MGFIARNIEAQKLKIYYVCSGHLKVMGGTYGEGDNTLQPQASCTMDCMLMVVNNYIGLMLATHGLQNGG